MSGSEGGGVERRGGAAAPPATAASREEREGEGDCAGDFAEKPVFFVELQVGPRAVLKFGLRSTVSICVGCVCKIGTFSLLIGRNCRATVRTKIGAIWTVGCCDRTAEERRVTWTRGTGTVSTNFYI